MAMNGVAGFRRPPPGFTPDQWREFEDRGLLVIENAFSMREMAEWHDAVLRVQRSAATNSDGFFTLRNFVEADPAFACLIDHPAYVGFVYDLYGEMLKLQLSELFVRAPGEGARPERWHIDGPRVLPYAVFAPAAPMQVKVGIWLTDVLCHRMGNLAFVPGSHRRQYFDAYDTDETAPGEEQLLVRRGSLTLMDTALWHRTVPNTSAAVRVNLYLGYSPSWLPTSDRNESNAAWLATLNREQRIIMRSYSQAFDHAKPPQEDYPLFLDRDTGADRDPHRYRDHVRLLHRKRTVVWERLKATSFADRSVD
jgi:ectoine hydroxylase-related dioxygenase (phytanoyl-CoA dioxygenase family)